MTQVVHTPITARAPEQSGAGFGGITGQPAGPSVPPGAPDFAAIHDSQEFTALGAEHTVGEQAHYLGHLDALKSSLTVAENLAFWTRYLGAKAADPEPVLSGVGLGGLAGLPAAYLSAGQRRRLSSARLLAVPRPIWLLDEPTSALDAAGQEQLAELMRAHLGNGGMILAATHGPLGIDAKELGLGSPP